MKSEIYLKAAKAANELAIALENIDFEIENNANMRLYFEDAQEEHDEVRAELSKLVKSAKSILANLESDELGIDNALHEMETSPLDEATITALSKEGRI